MTSSGSAVGPPGDDEVLVARIRDEIAAQGPITFARFMERALYEPGHGYYRRETAGPGMAGADFLTAPEAHPIFGAAIGRLAEQAWDAMGRPASFTLVEPGAGSGALAAGMLDALRSLAPPLFEAIRYRPIEVEPARLDSLRARLHELALDDRLAPAASAPGDGMLVANEVVDALPVHRVIGRPAGLRELLVTIAGDRLAWHEAEPTTPQLQRALDDEGVTLGDGQVTEVCLAMRPWLQDAVRAIDRGLVVIVDYAAEPGELHGTARPDGTLRTFADHAVGGDPFRDIGRRDLTATVDLAALRAAAAAAGLAPAGETTQAELLARAGTSDLTDTYLRRPGATLQDALHLRSALARLLDPRGMGGFRVLAFARGLDPVPRLPLLDHVGPRR